MTAESRLTTDQKRKYETNWTENGKTYRLVAVVRYRDECGHGHNTFSITATLYENGIGIACGCMHDEITKRIPELADYIQWHLVSSDGPLHYIENTVYLAGDRDCWGLRKGEKRQIKNGKTGLFCWELVDVSGNEDLPKYVDCATQPGQSARLEYRPWCRIGEGKERELDAARKTAIWPEATDAELSQEPAALKAALLARHPELMKRFRVAVESLGFVY